MFARDHDDYPDALDSGEFSREFSRTIRRLADLRQRPLTTDEGVVAQGQSTLEEQSALDRLADRIVADIERDDPVDTGAWIDHAPCLPDRPDLHIVSRLGLCKVPWAHALAASSWRRRAPAKRAPTSPPSNPR